MANKEQCPYCGKYYVYLNRHKCPNEPIGQKKVVEIKELKLDKLEKEDKEPSTEVITPQPVAHQEIPEKEDVIIESHSNTVKFISKFFTTESINIGKEKEKNIVKGVFNNPIESFKFLNNKEVNFIKAILRANTVVDLLKFKDKNIYNFITTDQLKNLEKKGIETNEFLKKVQKAISIASILNQLREKALKLDKTKNQQKVIVAGLDQAGKTAILTTFGGKLGLNELAKLRPTKRIERKNIETEDLSLFIWDFGGQSTYREEYIKNPGAYFIGVDLLIYVIDVQDYERFDESFKYLKGIVDALIMLEESPYLLIFIHKLDPDLRENPDLQLNVEFIKENLTEILSEAKFSYEIYLTSIYSVISREPQFSKYIKEMITQHKDLVSDPTHERIEALGEIINNVLNAIIRLSESTSRQYYEIDTKFQIMEARINSLAISRKAVASPTTITPQNISVIDLIKPVGSSNLHPPPPPPPPPGQIDSALAIQQSNSPTAAIHQSVRSSILTELKALFAKTKELNR